MYKIYYLTSIIDDYKPRYIGYTSLELEKRLKEHIRESKYDKKWKTHKMNWINKLLRNNIEIEIFLIKDDIEKINEALDFERYYIENFDSNSLTNSTNGGEISKTYKEDVKNKIKNSLKEYFAINDVWNKGKKMTTPNKSKGIRRPDMEGENNFFYNKKHTAETRKIISDKNRKHRIYTYDELYYLYIELNLSQKEIAVKFELTRPYVCRLMKKNKLVEVKKNKYGRIK